MQIYEMRVIDFFFFFFVGKKELLLFPERKNGTEVIDLDFKV